MHQGGPMRAPYGSYDSGRGGPPPPPPMGYNMGWSGHQQQQKFLPRGGGGFVNGGRGGYPPPGGPPPRHGTPNSSGQMRPMDDSEYQLYSSAYRSQPEPTMGINRSKTMPASSAQPRYQAYNPASHAPATVPNANATQNPAYGVRQVPESQWTREGVADVLATYLQKDHYDDYVGEHTQAEHAGQSGSLRTAPPGNMHPQANGRWNGGASEFAQQAHRSQSQPDLTGRYRAGAQYDGPAETPADLLPITRPSTDGHSVSSQSSVPVALRTGSSAPGSVHSNNSIRSVRNPVPPQTRPSVRREGGLPAHPTPADVREAEQAAMRRSDPDLLPAHPPPVRAGLLQEAGGRSTPAHTPPPPIRQYEDDRKTDRPSPPSVEAPVTLEELERLRDQVASRPNDYRLQLKLAKKMVEAASTLAIEGGRADIKTTRKNREKYIFDAHKLVKKLATAVSSRIFMRRQV